MMSDVATIQIRNVPDDVHRTYQRRAAEAGQSLQEYLLAELVRSASRKTPAEVVAEVERRIALEGPGGFATESSVEYVREDRESH